MSKPHYLEALAARRRQLNDQLAKSGYQLLPESGEAERWFIIDADGIVVVPRAVCEQALARAEAVVATENEVRDAVRAGTLPREAFERYGKF